MRRFLVLVLGALLASTSVLRGIGATASPSASLSATQQSSSEGVQLERLSDLELVARLPAPDQCWDKRAIPWRLQPVAAELSRRAENGRLSEEGWRAAIRAADVFHTRATWPKDVPLEVWIREPTWLRWTRISLVARSPDLGRIQADNRYPSWCGNCRDEELEDQRRFVLGAMPGDTRRVMFDATIEQLHHTNSWEPVEHEVEHALWKGELPIAVASVDTIDECLPPVAGAELDALVRQATSVQWWSSQAMPEPKAMLYVDIDPRKHPALSRIGVSLEIDVLRAGNVVESMHVCADRSSALEREDAGTCGYCAVTSLPPKSELHGAELDLWQLRVRGTWKGLLSLWEADHWWQGEFTVPLAELVRDDR